MRKRRARKDFADTGAGFDCDKAKTAKKLIRSNKALSQPYPQNNRRY
jgi:hypothetical protein